MSHIQYGQALKCRITWHFMPASFSTCLVKTNKKGDKKKVIEISYFAAYIMSIPTSRT